jgi:hypothetical protein
MHDLFRSEILKDLKEKGIRVNVSRTQCLARGAAAGLAATGRWTAQIVTPRWHARPIRRVQQRTVSGCRPWAFILPQRTTRRTGTKCLSRRVWCGCGPGSDVATDEFWIAGVKIAHTGVEEGTPEPQSHPQLTSNHTVTALVAPSWQGPGLAISHGHNDDPSSAATPRT